MRLLHVIPTQTALCVHPVASHARTFACMLRRVALHRCGSIRTASALPSRRGWPSAGACLATMSGPTSAAWQSRSIASAVFVPRHSTAQHSTALWGLSDAALIDSDSRCMQACLSVDNWCTLTTTRGGQSTRVRRTRQSQRISRLQTNAIRYASDRAAPELSLRGGRERRRWLRPCASLVPELDLRTCTHT